MKISIEKNLIYKSLSHVQSIVEKKNTIPILSNILLDTTDSSLVLSATDMDISITETINCSVMEQGSVTVPAHTLYDIVRKIPDGSEIEFISNDGKKFSIRSGKSRFSLSCLPKKDFPLIEIDKLNCEFSINSNIFLKLIEKTRFAISNEDNLIMSAIGFSLFVLTFKFSLIEPSISVISINLKETIKKL